MRLCQVHGNETKGYVLRKVSVCTHCTLKGCITAETNTNP